MKEWTDLTLPRLVVKEMTYIARVHPVSVSRRANGLLEVTLTESDQERLEELGYGFIKAVDHKTGDFLAFGRITGHGWDAGRSASYFHVKVKEMKP